MLSASFSPEPELPVVLSSGYDKPRAIKEFDANRLAGFVQKPYVVQSLLTTVKRASVTGKQEELRRKLLSQGSLVLTIKVLPRAKISEVLETSGDDILKVRVVAAPDKGRANEEVCSLLAGYLGVPNRNVEVTLGLSSRQKRVRVTL